MKNHKGYRKRILAVALAAVTVLGDTQNLVAYAAEFAAAQPRFVSFEAPEPLTDLTSLIQTEEEQAPLSEAEIDALLAAETGKEPATTEESEPAKSTETTASTESTEPTETMESTEAAETESTETTETTETKEPAQTFREPVIEQPQTPEGTLTSYTADSATYALGDGKYQTIFGSNIGTYEDENGTVQLVDNTLERSNTRSVNVTYQNAANAYTVTIPEEMNEYAGMTISRDGYSMEMIPEEGDYTNAVIRDNAVLYNNVYDNTDVQYTVYDNSIKEDIILYAASEKTSYTYRIEAEGLTVALENQSVVLRGPEGNAIFALDAPLMEDAAGDVSLGVVLSLAKKNGDTLLTVTPDAEWLSDTDRSYPVKIDPSQIYVDPSKFGLHCVEEGSPRTVIGDNNYPYVGYDDGIVTGNLKNYGTAHLKSRTYVNIAYDFSELGEDAVIEDAVLKICQTTHFGGGGNEIGLFTTDEAWNPKTLTWNSQTAMAHTFLNSQRTTARAREWIEYDITDYVNDHAQGIAADSGLVLKSMDEKAQCEVFYNRTSALYGPQIVISWSENGDDPFLATLPLDALTINVRPMNEKSLGGKLKFDAVFADGLATAGAEVSYALSGGAAGSTTALTRYAYPNSLPFLELFPNATKYKSLQSNWQSGLYQDLAFNQIYQFTAEAEKDGASSGKKTSDTFVIYPVSQFDTFQKIAAYYGVELNTILRDNRIQDSLVVAGNTIFVRNPKTAVPYSPSPLSEADMAAIDGLLMGRGLHCEFGFEPVNLNTGNFYMEQQDAAIQDIGGDFAIDRNYNSKGAAINSPFGFGWSFAYDEILSMTEDGRILYKKGDGSYYYLTMGEDGSYHAPAGYEYTLTPVYGASTVQPPEGDTEEEEGTETWPDTTITSWTLTDGSFTTKTFNASGMLTAVTDRHGNTTSISYDESLHLSAITSPAGKTYGFTTDERGRILSASLPNGAVLAYTYDGAGNLTAYTNANGDKITYQYDTAHRMTSWKDAGGSTVVTNRYDDSDRVVKQTDAEGNVSTLSYGTGTTTTTDNNGNKTVYHYDGQYRTTGIDYPDGSKVTKTYDADNHLASETDQAGNTTSYTYDASGNLTGTTRADGTVSTTTYDEKNQMLSSTDYNGNTTSYRYDGRGNLTATVYADGATEAYEYDSSNRLVSATDGTGIKTSYTYTGAVPATYTDGTGQVWSYAYNAMNLLTEEKDPLGNRTIHTYDKEGRETQTVAADGGSTLYEYDPAGNVLSITDARGKKSSFTYDTLGHILKGTDALGNTLTYTYDKNYNKTSETDALGNVTAYTYDTMNHLVSETDKNGNQTTYTYDKLGNLVKRIDAEGHSTSYTYDTVRSTKTSETDGNGNTTSYTYDANGNQTGTTNADGSLASYRYDSRNRLAESTDALGLTSTYQYDGAGNLTGTANSLEESVTFAYNGNHQLTASTNALGHTEHFGYDAAGRQISHTDGNGAKENYAYDAAGRLTETIDAEGGKTTTAYDLNGNVISTTDANGNTTSCTYDAINRMTSVTDAKGGITVYEYDAVDNMVKTTDALKGITAYTYDGMGNVRSMTDANGNTYTYAYDKTGHSTAVTLPTEKGAEAATAVMTYDAAYNLVTLTDAQGLKTSYVYDRNRIAEESDNTGIHNRYTYDAAGNVLSKTDALERITGYAYDTKGRMLSVTEADGSVTAYAYDKADQLVKVTDAEGHETAFAYDAAGNNTAMSQSEEKVYQYAYNKIHALVTETDPLGAGTSYTYDPVGNLVEATDADGNRTSYIYDALYNVVSAKDGNGNTTALEYDALDRMIKKTDAEGAVTEYRYDALGNLTKYKDENGLITEYQYSVLNYMVKSISPLGAVETYDYDIHGNVTKEVDALKNTTTYDVDLNGNITELLQANGGKYTYQYDAAGRMTEVTTPLDYTINMTYDVVDNLLQESDSMDRTTSYEYDRLHHMTKTTDAEGGISVYSYDAYGNLASEADPMGRTTSYDYDLSDRMVAMHDPLQQVTTVNYDPVGNVSDITTPGARTTGYNYDGNYNQTSITDPMGYASSYIYDKTNRLVSEVDALSNSNAYAYDPAGQLLSYIDRRGNSENYTYDNHGNVSVYTDFSGRVTRYSYDLNNNLTKVEDAEGGKTYYEYDSMNQMTAYINALDKTTTYTYDPMGNQTSMTDDAGRTERSTYDVAGRLIATIKNSGSFIGYDYDKLNRLVEKSYQNKDGSKAEDAVLYGYNANGERVSMMDTTGESTYEYDALGRITAVTNGAGKTVTYTYDEAGNLTELGYPDGTKVSYTYDLNNNLTSVTDKDGEIVTYRYDELNRLKVTNRPGSNTATYVMYDEEGNVTRLKNICTACEKELSVYEYTYNEMGYVTEEKATEAVTIFCNGHLNGNGNTHTGNNSDGTKHDNCHHGKFGSTKKESTEDCGCYTAKVTTTSTYIYNDNWEVLSCTKKRDGASNIKYCYTYDRAGNRTQSEEWCGNTRTDVVNYTYNSANQIETSTTLEKKKWVTTTYEYDADGNLIETIAGKDQIKNITTYEYDTENRLKAVTGGKDLLLAVTYDGDGNRAFQLDFCPPAKAVGARDTKIPEGLSDAALELYDRITNNGGNASPNYCLTEYLNNVNTTYAQTLVEYGINFDSEVTYTYGNERISIKTEGRKRDVYGNKLNKETSKCYYIYDGRGSVERVLNEEHETDKFAYDPFGNLTLGYSDNVNSNSLVHRTGNMYTYNAEDYNRETGFQYLRARWYDTNTARFISEDSYLGTKAEPLTRNRYIYTSNNPMNYVDPSGYSQINLYSLIKQASRMSNIQLCASESTLAVVPAIPLIFEIVFDILISLGITVSFLDVLYSEPTSYLTEEQLQQIQKAADESKQEEAADSEGKSEEDSNSDHMFGENGVKVGGSKTTGQKGSTERVDVENPAPGKREGDIHYHDSKNTKWRYDPSSGQLKDADTGKLAPPRVQKVTEESWFQKAIGRGLNILGE